jgi:hypothetical protein
LPGMRLRFCLPDKLHLLHLIFLNMGWKKLVNGSIDL